MQHGSYYSTRVDGALLSKAGPREKINISAVKWFPDATGTKGLSMLVSLSNIGQKSSHLRRKGECDNLRFGSVHVAFWPTWRAP